MRQRNSILQGWLNAAVKQPFHECRPERAVADHVPGLFDALVAVLRRAAPRWIAIPATLSGERVLTAAADHARARFEQGLHSDDVVSEFLLLRQEIGRALRVHLADSAPASDVIGAELVVHDALNGAIALALRALSTHVTECETSFSPRLSLGRLEFETTTVDLADVLGDVLARLDPQVASRVHVDAIGDVFVGAWDRLALDRVLTNLLANALKYSPPNTPIRVTLLAEADTVQVSVHDEGIGLESDEVAGLFKRYGRSRTARECNIQGVGLGLFLSCELVVGLGGQIWAESPGRDLGATFHVELPRGSEAHRPNH